MIRPSENYVILKEDIKNGIVQRKRYTNKRDKFIEYWIYKYKETSIYSPFGKKYLDTSNKELKCIIVCDDNNYIVKDGSKGFMVRGIKFTEEHINQYLHKTNRSQA